MRGQHDVVYLYSDTKWMSYCDMSAQVFLTGVMMPGPDSKNAVINSFQINGRNNSRYSYLGVDYAIS